MNTTPQFSTMQINGFLQEHYQLDGELKALPGYCDQNYLLRRSQQKYIVKIANSGEQRLDLEMQNSAMAHLTEQALPVPHALANQAEQLLTTITSESTGEDGQVFHLRVLSYLDGNFYADSPADSQGPELWSHLGQFMGKITQALGNFDHPGAYRYLDWDLQHGGRIIQQKKHLLSDEQQALVEHFQRHYHTQIQPVLAQLPTGILHNDANDYNLLVDNTEKPQQITGLIDFGDMVHSQVINELAIACAYALLDQADPLEVISTIAAGYHQQRPLSALEIESLFGLTALRLCTSVCNSALAIQQQPDNEYLLVSAKPAWHSLAQLKNIHPLTALCRIRQRCGLAVDPGKNKQQIIDYRRSHLGKTLSLSYQEPLKMIRGQGAYLYNEQGRPYLDMVNNVCHVGHCHPDVVAAGQRQLALLNTNTRYLHDNLIDYADRLLATMPDPLSVCFFVNSGSEANELAFRLARCATGSRDLLVVDGAYHGNTNACIEASPYKFDGPGGEGAAAHIHKVPLPDPYRGPHTGPDSSEAYANGVARVIAQLAAENKQPGAFICESLQGVAGQIIMPEGYLRSVYQQVRQAGGVCIADEVQVGFGRVGSHMWAFETQDVVPDIVTLGKPIGNGHPMAAVITTQAIADAFVTGMEYFNTFGGNPVSCAIGLAVLDVIEKEQLQEKALETGNYIKEQLRQLQTQFPIIGDVRGLGLFIGAELVTDRDNKTPATEETAWLVEFMKEHGILLSTEGPFYNILKIKPPLAFNRDDADKFITALRQGLTELAELPTQR